MERLAKRFPEGMAYTVVYDTTTFVQESISEVLLTLGEAILLVLLVAFIFLQNWRATLIPAITIPVSLIGTFVLMNVLGFSIDLPTLFGLVLATGLVVDDAIIAVEHVPRFMVDQGRQARQAMREAMGGVVFLAVQPRFRLGWAGIWPHGQGTDPRLDVCADRLCGAARHHLLYFTRFPLRRLNVSC